MYATIDQFAIDKATNTLIEEGFAPLYIRHYYVLMGKKVLRVDKNLGDYKQQRKYDLIDSLGVTWEVKFDRIWATTGNFYLEQQTLEASEADKYLIFAGKAYIVQKQALVDAIAAGTALTRGGDNLRSLGLKITLQDLEAISEAVIVL